MLSNSDEMWERADIEYAAWKEDPDNWPSDGNSTRRKSAENGTWKEAA